MFQYSHYKYCLQDKSTHFDLRVSTHLRLEASGQSFRTESHKRRISNILDDFSFIPTFDA